MTVKPGHNSKVKAGPVVAGRLKSFVERIEKLREEKKAISEDERDVFTEAKGVGYDAPTIRWLLKEREIDAADRDERDALRDTYAHALGMAVSMVQVEGLSLRQAEAATGVSKSSIQRAIAVPAVSQVEMVAADLECLSGRDETSDEHSRKATDEEPAGEAAGNTGGSHEQHHPLANRRPGMKDSDDKNTVSPAEGEKSAHTAGEGHDAGLTPEPEVARCAPPAPAPAEEIEALGLSAVVRDLKARHPTITDDAASQAMLDAHERLESLKRQKGFEHE